MEVIRRSEWKFSILEGWSLIKFFLPWIWFQDHWYIVEFHFLGNFGRALRIVFIILLFLPLERLFFSSSLNKCTLFLLNEFVFKHRSYPVPAIQSCNVYTFNDKDALSLSLSLSLSCVIELSCDFWSMLNICVLWSVAARLQKMQQHSLSWLFL